MKDQLLYIHRLPINSRSVSIISVLHQCKALGDVGYDVTLALPDSRLDESLTNYVQNNFGFNLKFRIELFNPILIRKRITWLSGFWGKWKIIQSSNADYVITRTAIPALLAVLSGRKVILEFHNLNLHSESRIIDFLLTMLIRYFYNHNSSFSILTISNNLKENLIKRGFSHSRLRVYHDCISTEQFVRTKKANEYRQELNLPDGIIVTYSGSLSLDRDILKIVDLAKYFPSLTFVVLGGNKDQINYFARAVDEEDIKNVIIIGKVAQVDVPKYLFASDILLMLWSKKVKTINYCSPLKLFEYMAAGALIIGYGFPTIHEVLENQVDSLLVEPESLDELIKAIEQGLEMNREEFGKRAREKVISKYTWLKRAEFIRKEIINE